MLMAVQHQVGRAGSQTIYVGEHETCPKCGHRLAGVFRGGDKP
jgi:hypothetical protein